MRFSTTREFFGCFWVSAMLWCAVVTVVAHIAWKNTEDCTTCGVVHDTTCRNGSWICPTSNCDPATELVPCTSAESIDGWIALGFVGMAIIIYGLVAMIVYFAATLRGTCLFNICLKCGCIVEMKELTEMNPLIR